MTILSGVTERCIRRRSHQESKRERRGDRDGSSIPCPVLSPASSELKFNSRRMAFLCLSLSELGSEPKPPVMAAIARVDSAGRKLFCSSSRSWVVLVLGQASRFPQASRKLPGEGASWLLWVSISQMYVYCSSSKLLRIRSPLAACALALGPQTGNKAFAHPVCV